MGTDVEEIARRMNKFEQDFRYVPWLLTVGFALLVLGLFLLFEVAGHELYRRGSVIYVADPVSFGLWGLLFTIFGFPILCYSIYMRIAYPLKLRSLKRDLKHEFEGSFSRLLVGLTEEQRGIAPSLQRQAKEMCLFLKDYLDAGVSLPRILVFQLRKDSWRKLGMHLSRRPLTLDNGKVISHRQSEEYWAKNIGGTTSKTPSFLTSRFPHDFLVFLNTSLIEEIARRRSSIGNLSRACFELMLGQTLMHEITHVYETLLHRKIIKGSLKPGLQDSFVVEAYEAFLQSREKA